MTDAQRLHCNSYGRLVFLLAVFVSGSGPLHGQPAPVDFKAIPKLNEVKERPAAPNFTLPNPDGRKVSLQDFRGKVVFLNFWATWCESCRDEMPSMQRLYGEFKSKGLEIVAVNVKEKRQDALAFARRFKLTYPILMDTEGEVGLLYGAFGLPATYLIDRNGVVLARMWGPADWYSPAARNLIKSLLEQQ